MKKLILFLSAAVLLLCTTTCSSEDENKGRFARNIPTCIKEIIKDSPSITRCGEYCSTDDTKKIYELVGPPGFGSTGFDENCNLFLIPSEEFPIIVTNPDDWDWAFVLPDGTIKYKEDIYHFKRVVFTQK